MRLIDADRLWDVMNKATLNHLVTNTLWNTLKSVVKNAPTIDAVQVVRCKDCKHRDPEDKKCDCGHDILWQLPRADEWFCADGERGDPE